MAPLDELNTYLAGSSYLGSPVGVTLEDYKACKEIPAKDVDESKPHLLRWHAHVSYLMLKYPKFDWRGELIPAGKPPAFGNAPVAAAAAKEPAPKKEPAKKEKEATKEKEAAPKDKAAPKEAAAKEDKKKGKDKAEPKKDEPPAPPTEEELAKMKKDKLKKVIKEGGKRGVEIEGAADMGGLQFFCTSMDLPEGDLELLVESMKAMNAKSDPTEEERKGGSGHIGKMIFSAGVEQLAVVAYVPEAKQQELSCEAWLKKVLGTFSGEVVSAAKDLSTGVVKTNSDKGVFPLKIREPMILEANNFLRSKGLFPEDNDDDDDEMVFGDDDFPS